MKYAILGDIHGNRTALSAVFAALDEVGVDQVVSVGDVVGYGPSPAECIDILVEREVIVVKGNHDAACVGELDDRYFNNYAREAIRWTRTAVSASRREWLSQLPMSVRLEHCEVAHGSLHEPEYWTYIQTPSDASPSLDIMERSVCFVGHTHIPVVLSRDVESGIKTTYRFGAEIDLKPGEKVLVNVGSVGQPRDEDPRAAYVIFDSANRVITIHRIEYDIDAEAQRSAKSGLPKMLADRLYLGV